MCFLRPPSVVSISTLFNVNDQQFFCLMNTWDEAMSSCSAPQESQFDLETLFPSPSSPSRSRAASVDNSDHNSDHDPDNDRDNDRDNDQRHGIDQYHANDQHQRRDGGDADDYHDVGVHGSTGADRRYHRYPDDDHDDGHPHGGMHLGGAAALLAGRRNSSSNVSNASGSVNMSNHSNNNHHAPGEGGVNGRRNQHDSAAGVGGGYHAVARGGGASVEEGTRDGLSPFALECDEEGEHDDIVIDDDGWEGERGGGWNEKGAGAGAGDGVREQDRMGYQYRSGYHY